MAKFARVSWLSATALDGRTSRALELRGLIRNALDPESGGCTGFALTVQGRAYVEKHWP